MAGGSSPILKHNTFSGVVGGPNSGNGVYVDVGCNANLVNSIVANHMTGIAVQGSAIVDYVLWFNNITNSSGIGLALTHEFSGDPAFAYDYYHLTADSKALDVASNAGITNDVDGETPPRFRASTWALTNGIQARRGMWRPAPPLMATSCWDGRRSAVDGYYVYRSSVPFYEPDPGGPPYASLDPWEGSFHDEDSGLRDPARNFTYIICAWYGTELDCAPPVGEFDFGLAPGVGP